MYVESRLKLELFELDGLRLVLRVRRYDCAGCDGDGRAGHGPRAGHLVGADGKAFRVRVRVRLRVRVGVRVRVRVRVRIRVRVRVRVRIRRPSSVAMMGPSSRVTATIVPGTYFITATMPMWEM